MKTKTRLNLSIIIIFGSLIHLSSYMILLADGKLLRGEKWQKFSLQDNKADFYVASNGNDLWSGKLESPNQTATDGPFLTIQRAQQAVRDLKGQVYIVKDAPVEKRWIGSPHKYGKGKDILVLIREGYYILNEPLRFLPEDGGERVETNLPSGAFEYHKLRDHYVTYAAYPGETVVISGGKKISQWENKGKIWTAKLDVDTVLMIVANGQKQILARTPDTGYFLPPYFSKTNQELYFESEQLKSWENISNNRVIMLLRWHRAINSFIKIDQQKQLAYLKDPQPGILIVPPRYYVENIEDLLDSSGEWFFNEKNKQLYFIPPEKISNPNEAVIVNPILSQLLIIQGNPVKPVRNLRFYGLHFEGATAGGSALVWEYAHAGEVVDCELRSLGGSGILLGKGCYQLKILSNQFQTIDNNAITVNGNAHPENWMDIIRETIISYNRITDSGGTNISAYNTLFTTISRNEISNTRGRFAISVGGWLNLEEAIDGGYQVEYNHLYQVQKDADDSGVIKTAGLTHDSYIRYNLIHDVKAGYFNDNVGFWFDNMSSGWIAEQNIFYNLEQGEMKLCAANLVDNIYRNNFIIDPPFNPPEGIIEGEPVFLYENLKINPDHNPIDRPYKIGDFLTISAEIKNIGSTGTLSVPLFINGKITHTILFPVIHNNTRTIRYRYRVEQLGEYRFAIGSTPFKSIQVEGEIPGELYSEINLSDAIFSAGDSVSCSVWIKNLEDFSKKIETFLFLDDHIYERQQVVLPANDLKEILFSVAPQPGKHRIRIGNSPEKAIEVFSHQAIDMKQIELNTYVSATANSSELGMDQKKNKYRITAGGSDFFHAEDSYAVIYPKKKINGNFVATVKISKFRNRTHEWFRAGLFARNNMRESFDIRPGSLGSVLFFTTPSRAGIQWDEFGNGCMHKAISENLPENMNFPIWLKLMRHGNVFSGAISYDGKIWVNHKQTTIVPGLLDQIDIGIAAGSCDQIPYWIEFEDFKIEIEN
jgi:hypothetical protein